MQKIQGKGSKPSYYCKTCDTTFGSLEAAEAKHQSCKPKKTKQHDKKEKITSDSATDEGFDK